MECPSCRTENAEGAKFCSECGTSLADPDACANCGAPLAADAKFCSECGQPVTTEPAADPVRDKLRRYIPDELLSKLEHAGRSHVAGERRTVTMLFCDIEGSTAAAEDLDPEDWAEIINGAFEHLIRPVYEYEGTLARLMGDAILAFFGAPISHEDDPQRAVLAGLGIRDGIRPYAEEVEAAHGIHIGVRIGINTGLVVVGEMGSDLRLEYTAMGDAVNLAARMEQTAEAGTIQVSDDTWRLIDPFFDTEELGPVEVKGKSEPVRTHRVLGERAEKGSLRGLTGLSSPMVGRDGELTTLRSLVDDLSTGRGAIASVMGEAGLGKSRLVRELHAELEAAGRLGSGDDTETPVRWEIGRCYSYESGRPFAPFIDLFETCFGIDRADTDSARADKVAAAVESTVGPERSAEVRPYLLSMLGLPLDGPDLDRVQFLLPPELRAKVFDAVFEVMAALGAERPIAVILEDLHWADTASIDLAEHLLPLSDQVMIALIGVFRPRREDPSWRFHEVANRDHHHRYTPIELRPLDEAHGRDLVGNLLYIEGLTEEVRSLILAKAEGNPLFVEEVIRSLVDTGAVVHDGDTWRATRDIADVTVPDSLASLITTRLDRLDDPTKLTIYTAAVLGREFDAETLQAVTPDDVDVGPALGTLERRELVREIARIPTRRYRFRHVLTQETAYNSALNKTRRHIHRNVAFHLERTEPDNARALARHWLGADEGTRAVPYLAAAGEQAFASYSAPEAIAYFERATALLGEDSTTEIGRRAWEGLATARTFSADIDGANRAAEGLIAFGESRDDVPTQVAGLNKMGFANTLGGAEELAFSCLEQATDLASGVEDLAGLAEAHQTYCYLKTNRGDLESALENQQQSQSLGRDLGAPTSRAFGLVHYANTLVYLTRYDEAKEAAEKARAYCEEAGLKQFLGEVLGHTEPFILMREGRFAEALSSSEEGTALVRETGASIELATCTYTLGQCQLQLGYLEAALVSFEETKALGEAIGMAYLTSAATASLASTHHALGDIDRIPSLHEMSNADLEAPMGNAMASAALADMGFCALQLGDVGAAADYFERGLAIRSATSLLMQPMLGVGAGLVALQREDRERAGHLIDEAAEYAATREMRHFEPLMGMARAQLHLADGDGEAGLVELRDAEAKAATMGMLPMVQMLAGARAEAASATAADDEARTAAFRYAETVGVIASRLTDEERRSTYLGAATGVAEA